jgi:glycosyltransferase 2 family protein
MSDKSSSLKRLYPWIGVTVFGLAAFLIHRALRGHSLEEIVQSLGAISSTHLALGAAFTAGSFLCLTANDTLAIRYTKGDLPYRRIALASLISLSIGHTLGLAAFSSGAVRYRFYTAWGLSAGDVGRIILFCGATVLVGLTTLGAIAALTQPPLVARMIGVGSGLVIAAGVALLVLLAAYLALTTFVRRPIHIRNFTLPLPPLMLAIGQILVGTCDFLFVSAVLHQMLSASAEIGFLPLAAVYVMANTAAIVSHVPGGLGVIEAVILSLVPGANVIGALIAFRTIYFLIPFVIGSLMLGAFELAHRRHRASPG